MVRQVGGVVLARASLGQWRLGVAGLPVGVRGLLEGVERVLELVHILALLVDERFQKIRLSAELQGRRIGRVVPKDLLDALVNRLQQPERIGDPALSPDRPLRLGQVLANQQGSQVQVQAVAVMALGHGRQERGAGGGELVQFAQAKTFEAEHLGPHVPIAEVRDSRELLAELLTRILGLTRSAPSFRVQGGEVVHLSLVRGQQGAQPLEGG